MSVKNKIIKIFYLLNKAQSMQFFGKNYTPYSWERLLVLQVYMDLRG